MAPYASGLAALVDDEMDLGATCVDMGAGTTRSRSSASASRPCDVIAVGGAHVTKDIATGLSTTLVHAERMKTLHGSVLAGPADEREMLSVPLIGEDEQWRAPARSPLQPQQHRAAAPRRDFRASARPARRAARNLGGRRVVLTAERAR